MGLPRFILIAIIIAGGLWLWRRIKQRTQATAQPSPVHTMVCCAHCHVHLPENRAIQDNQQHWFCSSAHRSLGPQSRD